MKSKVSVFEKLGLIEKIEPEGLIEVDEVVDTSDVDRSVTQKDKILKIIDDDNKEYRENVVEVNDNTNEEIVEKAVESSQITQSESGDKLMDRELMKIEDIYKKYNINSEGINSLLIVESFLKALPDHLPQDMKRQSVLNIISYSGMNLANLIDDGEKKISHLDEFIKQFTAQSEKEISEYENEIKKLTEQINEIEKSINKVKSLREEQNAIVNYEVDRLNNIFKFINDNDK